MKPFVALGVLILAIVFIFIRMCRGIENIPDSGREMSGPWDTPWFKRKD